MKIGTALITGGAKRIGKSIALYLAKCGYDLVVHYNNSEVEAENLRIEIENLGVNCLLIKADLLDLKQVSNLLLEMKKIPNWNLLINNASIFRKSKFMENNINEFENNFLIHVKIPMLLSQALAENCAKNNLSGNIINMVDKNIVRYDTKYFDYILTKKTLAELTKMLALQLAPQIRVNAIAPGFILNSIDEENPSLETKELLKKIPLQKKANEDDITKAIKYFLDSDFVSGHILFVDGGAHLNHAG